MSLEKQRKKMSGSIRTGNMRNIRPDQNEDFIFSEIPNQKPLQILQTMINH